MDRVARASLAAYKALSPQSLEMGGVTVLRVDAAPDSPMLNRIVGLGVDRPATESDLDQALAAMGDEVTCYVTVDPSARPAELTEWLRRRGLEPGWGWMSFTRGAEEMPDPPTALRLVEVGPAEAEAFGSIVTAAYGLPESAARWAGEARARGWDCWLAVDGDEPAGAAGLFMTDGAAYLGMAATLPEHRGKGAQAALLALRIRQARENGCDLLVVETGERRDDLPSSSYRNILRAGFEEGTVTANWIRRARVS